MQAERRRRSDSTHVTSVARTEGRPEGAQASGQPQTLMIPVPSLKPPNIGCAMSGFIVAIVAILAISLGGRLDAGLFFVALGVGSAMWSLVPHSGFPERLSKTCKRDAHDTCSGFVRKEVPLWLGFVRPEVRCTCFCHFGPEKRRLIDEATTWRKRRGGVPQSQR
jgi:hypothetical protein